MGKPKFYHFVKGFSDSQGKTHIVTIVGKLEKERDYTQEMQETHPTDTRTIFVFDAKKGFKRTLSYAYSICHPDDFEAFTEEKGIKIAKRRLETNPLGEMSTTKITTLTKQQIEVILKGELDFIGENLEKFIQHI